MSKINQITLAVLWIAISLPTFAASQNKRASLPIEISSDALLVEQKKGLATYTGNVEVHQGQFFLYANRLEAYVKGGKIQKVIAYGTPAKFKKYDEQAKGWTHGKAKKIVYTPSPKKQLHLSHAAQVTQATGETLSSEQIQYLIESKTLQATGTKKRRVHVILPAQENE